MATVRIPILGHATLPDASGDVFWEPSSVKLTNDLFPRGLWIFNDTATRIGLSGSFLVPNTYVGSPAIIVPWTTLPTTGAVEWDVDLRAGAVGETIDPTTAQQSVNVADTAPGTTLLLQEAVLNFTAANFAALDEVPFTLFRDGTDAGDTLAGPALVTWLYFQFTDA